MNYYLYKLKFDSAVHFGSSSNAQSLSASDDHFCADTLFSALCHTALRLRGQEGLEALCMAAKDGMLYLSDSMPWMDDVFYLPKPIISARSERDVPAAKRKAAKKLKWVPVDDFAAFIDSVRGGDAYDAEAAQAEFGVSTSVAKVKIIQGEDSLPYQVGLYHFKDNAGLWFIAGCETEQLADDLQVLVEGLSLSGIGGKTSSGYGKFHVDDIPIFLNEPFDDVTEWLYSALENRAANRQLLLSASLPPDEELTDLLPNSEYMLIRRAGFVQSDFYAEENRKKVSQLFLAAGSVLPGRFSSKLYEVGEAGKHPVFRLSAPLFLGVDL